MLLLILLVFKMGKHTSLQRTEPFFPNIYSKSSVIMHGIAQAHITSSVNAYLQSHKQDKL